MRPGSSGAGCGCTTTSGCSSGRAPATPILSGPGRPRREPEPAGGARRLPGDVVRGDHRHLAHPAQARGARGRPGAGGDGLADDQRALRGDEPQPVQQLRRGLVPFSFFVRSASARPRDFALAGARAGVVFCFCRRRGWPGRSRGGLRAVCVGPAGRSPPHPTGTRSSRPAPGGSRRCSPWRADSWSRWRRSPWSGTPWRAGPGVVHHPVRRRLPRPHHRLDRALAVVVVRGHRGHGVGSARAVKGVAPQAVVRDPGRPGRPARSTTSKLRPRRHQLFPARRLLAVVAEPSAAPCRDGPHD